MKEQRFDIDTLSLQDLLISKKEEEEYTSPERPPDTRLAGEVFDASLGEELVITETGRSLPQENRMAYETERKKQAVTDDHAIQAIENFNSQSLETESENRIIIPEARIAVGTLFLAYDSRTGKFYIVTRENGDKLHNPLAGCRTANANLVGTESARIHTGDIMRAGYGDILLFATGREGQKVIRWPYPRGASTYSYRELKDSAMRFLDLSKTQRIPAIEKPYTPITLPGAKKMRVISSNGKEQIDGGYSAYLGPAGTIECTKLVYIGDLAEYDGLADGVFGEGRVVVEPLEGVLENLENLLASDKLLTAQKSLDPSQSIYNPIPGTTVFDTKGLPLEPSEIDDQKLLHSIYAPNAYTVLRVLHQMREQGISLPEYFSRAIEKKPVT